MNRTNKNKTKEDLKFQIKKIIGFIYIKSTVTARRRKLTNAVTNLEVYNSVFNITEHYKIFTFYRPGLWQDLDATK